MSNPTHPSRATSTGVAGPMRYVLKLFVAGTTPNSLRAVSNLTDICETYLKNKYRLEVIDIYSHPEEARDADIIAAPTLIKECPAPMRMLIGDMSNKERVLQGLEVENVA